MGQLRRKTLGALFLLPVLFAVSICSQAQCSPSITVNLGQRFGEFIVINHGAGTSLQSTVIIEERSGGKWIHIPVSNMELRKSCLPTSSYPECIELAADSTLRPVPWTGRYCYSQCPNACRLDGPAPPGTYRFVITSCDGKHTYASPPFKKP